MSFFIGVNGCVNFYETTPLPLHKTHVFTSIKAPVFYYLTNLGKIY